VSFFSYLWEVIEAALPLLKTPAVFRGLSGVRIAHPLDNAVVAASHFDIQGRFRWLFGMHLALFTIDGTRYWPQGLVHLDPTHNRWIKDVWIGTQQGKQYTISVIAVSREVMLAVNYYSQVHAAVQVWVPLTIHQNQMPEGFLELDRIVVTLK
jgi:hypothetical protein